MMVTSSKLYTFIPVSVTFLELGHISGEKIMIIIYFIKYRKQTMICRVRALKQGGRSS